MPKSKKPTEEILQLKNQLARALADYDNLVKRTDRERQEFSKLGSLRLILKLFTVVDMLEQAMRHSQDPGLAIILQQFKDTLKSEGYEEIKLKAGDQFDAHAAEVIDTLPGDLEQDGVIAEVTQSGWQYQDGTVVRHAKVKVYKNDGKTNL